MLLEHATHDYTTYYNNKEIQMGCAHKSWGSVQSPSMSCQCSLWIISKLFSGQSCIWVSLCCSSVISSQASPLYCLPVHPIHLIVATGATSTKKMEWYCLRSNTRCWTGNHVCRIVDQSTLPYLNPSHLKKQNYWKKCKCSLTRFRFVILVCILAQRELGHEILCLV